MSEFRTRLVQGNAEHLLFEILLSQFRAYELLRARGRQRSDSTHVLAAMRALNRLECVGSVMRHARNCLAIVAPEWTRMHTHTDWLERYGPRFDDARVPEAAAERTALATLVGLDGLILLTAIDTLDTPNWMREIPALVTLHLVWSQNFTWTETGTLRWRHTTETPPAGHSISSPYDHDARYSQKRGTTWIGDKIHLTERCDGDVPHIITNGETTPATVADDAVTERIHEALKQRDLLPDIHLVDTGYIDAELILERERQEQIDLFGPVPGDYHRQAKEGKGSAAGDFAIDWEAQQAVCPAGHTSISWTPAIDRRTNAVIKITCSMRDCQSCERRTACTDGQRRAITVRPHAHHEALWR